MKRLDWEADTRLSFNDGSLDHSTHLKMQKIKSGHGNNHIMVIFNNLYINQSIQYEISCAIHYTTNSLDNSCETTFNTRPFDQLVSSSEVLINLETNWFVSNLSSLTPFCLE